MSDFSVKTAIRTRHGEVMVDILVRLPPCSGSLHDIICLVRSFLGRTLH